MDPETEKGGGSGLGGGINIEVVWQHVILCVHMACLGHAPSGKINLDHMAGLLRPLVTTIYNHATY